MKDYLRIKHFRFNFVDIIISLITLVLVLISFNDYGSKLHFFPIIFGFGGLENALIGIRFVRNKSRLLGSIFLTASLALLSLGLILAINIWG